MASYTLIHMGVNAAHKGADAVKCCFEIAKAGLYSALSASLSLSEVTHPHLTLSVNNPLPCVINTA
jgi:hypothetical protein